MALAYAAAHGKLLVVDYLVGAGADVNYGAPLANAAYYGQWRVAEYLLEAGASLNVSGSVQRYPPAPGLGSMSEGVFSPMQAAVKENQLEIKRLFEQHGL